MDRLPAYIDSSVLLRFILKEPNPIPKLDGYGPVYSSRLLKIECNRVLQRLYYQQALDDSQCSAALQCLRFMLKGIEIMPLSDDVLSRAEEAFPAPLGTLDALHLASAIYLRDRFELDALIFLTHDSALGKGAASLGFKVVGG